MGIARFLASGFGRALRMILGSALVTLAIIWLSTETAVLESIILLIVGVIVFILGAVNMSIVAVLFGGPAHGDRALESKRS